MREVTNILTDEPMMHSGGVLYMSEAEIEANSISLEESERRLTALIDKFYAQK